MKIKTFIGIDVSKHWLDVYIKNVQQNFVQETRIKNTVPELIAWEKALKKKNIVLNASTALFYESTGVYTRILERFVIRTSCKVFMESPLRIKRSMGIARGKSDRIDARRIAVYGMRYYDNLTPFEPMRPVIKNIRQLLVNQKHLKKALNLFLVPLKELKAMTGDAEIRLLKQVNHTAIEGLNKSLQNTEDKLNALIRQDKQVDHSMQLLTSIPHIGNIIALNFIAATNEFKLHTNARTLACYAGVAPFEHSSGKSVKKRTRIDSASNKKLKSLLHLAAVGTVRKKGEFKKYFDRKVKEGKHKLSVLNAIRNKLVKRIAAVIKRDTPYVKESIYKRRQKTSNKI